MSSAVPGAGGAPPGEEGRPKVIYVMGAGRSGSTILGITLGNCEGIFFAGELARWHRRGGEPVAGEARDRFWGTVRESLGADGDSLGREVRFLQRSSGLLRVWRWPAQRRLRGPYRRITQELFEAISRAAGASTIVDTSHFPRRAHELQSLDGIDLHLLFLVRDPQGIVTALGRQDVVQGPGFGRLAANGYLFLTYLLSVLVFLRQPRGRRLLVDHETFLADPEETLRRLLEWSGSTAAIPDLEALQTGLGFLGNRLVGDQVVALRRQPERPVHGSRLTAVLQSPWRAILPLLKPSTRR